MATIDPQVNIEQIKRKSLSGVMSFFMRTLMLQLIAFASALILSAFFLPEDFAVFGIVTQVIALLVFFSDIGLAAALIQKKQEPTQEDYKTAFSVQQLLSWLIFFVVLILTQFSFITDKIGLAGNWILLALGFSFPLATLKTIPSIKLERKLDFSKLVLPQIFEQLLFHGILIVLAWRGYGLMAYVYAIVARSIIGIVVIQFLEPWLPRLGINRNSLRGLLGFGVKFQLNDLLARIKDQLYFLFLGFFLPLRDFGYLQWAKNWSMYPYNLTVQNVLAITFPTFSRLQAHPDLLRKAIEKSIYFISLCIFPILIGMSVFVFPLTELVPRYAKWQPALFSFVLFSLSVAWSAISTPLINSLNAMGRINQTLKLMVMWTTLTWLLTPIFVWKFAFNGVAVAAFVISWTSILSVVLIRRYLPVNVMRNVFAQLVASVAMTIFAVAGLSLWQQSFTYFFLGGALSVVVYSMVFLLVDRKHFFNEIASLRRHL
jgi:O-antigen/teichoic acid export membrane protein